MAHFFFCNELGVTFFAPNAAPTLFQRCTDHFCPNGVPTLFQRCSNAVPTLFQRCSNTVPTVSGPTLAHFANATSNAVPTLL